MAKFIIQNFIAFTGEIFKKLPFFTCWDRKNEEKMLLHQKVTKSGPSARVPDSFNSTLEFHGYNTPINCSGSIENPIYHDIWTSSNSRFVLKHSHNTVFYLPTKMLKNTTAMTGRKQFKKYCEIFILLTMAKNLDKHLRDMQGFV